MLARIDWKLKKDNVSDVLKKYKNKNSQRNKQTGS